MLYSEKVAQCAEHFAEHSSHGYSQVSRHGDGGRETITFSDGSIANIALGDRDCSSGALDCVEAAGLPTGGATYTGNMKKGLTSTGNWKAHKYSSGYSAKRGDIYLNEDHHTAVCVHPYGSPEGDMLMEFAISENGTIDGKEGDQTGKECYIHEFYNYPWDIILECIAGECPDAPGDAVDTPELEIHTEYALRQLTNGEWWPTVTDFGAGSEGYAGAPCTLHDLFTLKLPKGCEYKYRAHTRAHGWLDWVYKSDQSDTDKGCAGYPGEALDGLEIVGLNCTIYYRSQTTQRAGWLPVCCSNDTACDDWAGIYGEPLDRVQVAVCNKNPF